MKLLGILLMQKKLNIQITAPQMKNNRFFN